MLKINETKTIKFGLVIKDYLIKMSVIKVLSMDDEKLIKGVIYGP